LISAYQNNIKTYKKIIFNKKLKLKKKQFHLITNYQIEYKNVSNISYLIEIDSGILVYSDIIHTKKKKKVLSSFFHENKPN
jgi:hypothetical protein